MSARRSRHECGPACSCPVHGTPLIYWPHGDDHACQDAACVYGRGFEPAGAGGLTSMIGARPQPPHVRAASNAACCWPPPGERER